MSWTRPLAFGESAVAVATLVRALPASMSAWVTVYTAVAVVVAPGSSEVAASVISAPLRFGSSIERLVAFTWEPFVMVNV